ncbi:retrovirus-related pol polyprotein from transposon TNT 1-94 [Tanacetum coccineum]
MSCIPDDIMDRCVSAKETWTDLVHSFEGPSDTKENIIINLKLEYQTFRAKSTERLSQTYTHYKTLLNELANDDVNLSKHEINAPITTPSSTAISSAFFYNNVIQNFQENSNDKVDERSSEEYLRDLDIEYQERALLANSKRFIKRRNNFSGQKANENTECYKCGNKGQFARDCFSKTQADPKFQKDYKAEYKKMKAKLALLEAKVPDEEEVFDEEEVTHVKVLMALADDELTVGKSHARNGKWVDITIRKWQSRFLRYIDIRPNGDALRKCILEGPYTPSIVIIPAVPATDDSPEVPERTSVETILNVSLENKEHYQSTKEAIHLLLNRIGDEIYSTVDAYKTSHDTWISIERLQ